MPPLEKSQVLEAMLVAETAAANRAYIAAAEVFEVYASDQIAAKRFQSTKRGKEDCDLRAEIWNAAAKELREAAAK